MKISKFISFLVSLVLLICMSCTASADVLRYSLGDIIQDFTFTTYDGKEILFSDVLKEKEAVLLNIWATWCGPCRSEFPYMQQAYEKYQDKVEIIALSSEATDTDDVLADFAKQYSLTFLIGRDPVDFLSALGIGSIPTTLLIDRYGTICLIETGAQPNVESFERIFEAFIGDEYKESVLYRGLPPAKPDVPAASHEELTAALEADAFNPTQTNIWPMIPAEKDGRKVLVSTNAGQSSSEASVSVSLTAKAGEALVVTFKTSVESIFDRFKISVNDQVCGVFSGENDWTDYAIPVHTDGDYTVSLSYIKDHQDDAGEDAAWIDRVAVVMDGNAAVIYNPVSPLPADETALYLQDESAKEIDIEDASGLMKATFGNARYFITNADQAKVSAKLTDTQFPAASFFYTSHGDLYPLTDCIQDQEYVLPVAVDSVNTTGYACTSVLLYPDSSKEEYLSVLLFRDEENLDMLCQYNDLGSWHYLNEASDQSSADVLPDQVNYEIICLDQNNTPVSGVMVQICDATTCQVLVSDANGKVTFTAAPYAWEVHVLMAPDGYASDGTIVHTPVEGGSVVLTLEKQ